MTTIKYADLFCGLGSFHTAFHSNPRFKCVFACDIDEGIQTIYKANYGIHVHGDIRSVDYTTMPDIDILCAGFPCQPFSIAGNGEGFQDKEKGNLFYDILKMIDVKSPRMCILENVKNLKTHDGGRTYSTIERELTSRNYIVTSKVLTASDFGSPQARQRIFIVATKGNAFSLPEGTGVTNPVSSILDSSEGHQELNLDKYRLEEVSSNVTSLSKPKLVYNVVDKKSGKGGRQGERVYDPSHVGITICASSGGPGAKTGLYKVGSVVRRLNVREALGMFGFPVGYSFQNKRPEEALFYLGNSIVVNVVAAFVPLIARWFAETA